MGRDGAEGGDHRHRTADQFGYERLQSVDLIGCPAILDRDVAILGISSPVKPCRNAATMSETSSPDLRLKKPITGIAGCCDSAANGHAAAPPSRAMNSRRLIAPRASQLG